MFLKIKKITLLAHLAMSKPSLKYQKFEDREWYSLRSILGNDWAMFYCILGGRMTGKSYALAKFLCNQKRKKKDQVKNYWLRISDTSIKFMLANKAEKLIDPDLVREYHLELTTKGMNVYDHGEIFMQCMQIPMKRLTLTA